MAWLAPWPAPGPGSILPNEHGGCQARGQTGGRYPVLGVVLLDIPPRPGPWVGPLESRRANLLVIWRIWRRSIFVEAPLPFPSPARKVWSSPRSRALQTKHSRKSLQTCRRLGGIGWSPRWSPGGNIAGTSALFALPTPHDGVASRVVSCWRGSWHGVSGSGQAWRQAWACSRWAVEVDLAS